MDLFLTFIFAIVIFLGVMKFIVIADVILSWLSLLGMQLRPQFIASILDPIYAYVKSIIPTNF